MTAFDVTFVSAFARDEEQGNPAAVLVLEHWITADAMQEIAKINNLSETAYLVSTTGDADFELRWFTPAAEVSLCGHATLASAAVLFEHDPHRTSLTFASKSGPLHVTRDDAGRIVLDFPAQPATAIDAPHDLARTLGLAEEDIVAVASNGEKLLVEVPSEDHVVHLAPDLDRIEAIEAQGVVVTARGEEYDFVSRFFAPRVGVPEDPVTGSAHCMLAPWWAERLQKTTLRAFQRSVRGGEVRCEVDGARVRLAGFAVAYARREIEYPG